MRIIALLSLLFGFVAQLILDGQTFTHAILGIVCGAAAAACGLVSARRDGSNPLCRWEGRIMAGLGLVLAVFCLLQLPSAYRSQTQFNQKGKGQQQVRETAP